MLIGQAQNPLGVSLTMMIRGCRLHETKARSNEIGQYYPDYK